MKITLITVGKTDVKWVKEGMDLYLSRLVHYGRCSVVEIPQLKNVSALSKEEIKSKEGELILKNVRPGDELILLDEHGKERTSIEFSKWLESRLASGGNDLVFVIGGAYGFSEEVYKRSDSMISLSRMTFSHQMVRAIFLEQLYRAFTIMRGEPYHHE
ncbi:MAG: 23S rRNA (pseudouridine(1915)-N(3))-methyltransferase RlmH [Bacteroidales bacterium]|nr:23S rRNA (pseudouridine(1915)-N(3))-methyltransferase RlmH [Bacteroidales bacterium]